MWCSFRTNSDGRCLACDRRPCSARQGSRCLRLHLSWGCTWAEAARELNTVTRWPVVGVAALYAFPTNRALCGSIIFIVQTNHPAKAICRAGRSQEHRFWLICCTVIQHNGEVQFSYNYIITICCRVESTTLEWDHRVSDINLAYSHWIREIRIFKSVCVSFLSLNCSRVKYR